MTIEWKEPFQAEKNLDTMVRAQVGEHTILAQLTQEAVEDSDLETCKAVAGRMILAAVEAGRVPKLVVVKTSDLPRR